MRANPRKPMFRFLMVGCFALVLVWTPAARAQADDFVWMWMKGSSSVDQVGTYGTLGTPDGANTPGARTNAVSWTDALGMLWLFGGGGDDVDGESGWDKFNDLWRGDYGDLPPTPSPTPIPTPSPTPIPTPIPTPAEGSEWTRMDGASAHGGAGTYGTLGTSDPANTPGARNSAVSWSDDSGALWLFGGGGLDGAGDQGWLNDLWRRDPATGHWAWMKGAFGAWEPATYGTLGTPDPANTPGARRDAISWTDGSGALWLYGGMGYGAEGFLGDLTDLWRGRFEPRWPVPVTNVWIVR